VNCKRERNVILQNFLNSEELIAKTTLSREELKLVNFNESCPDLLVETIKVLILSYCNDHSEIKIIQNINKVIQG